MTDGKQVRVGQVVGRHDGGDGHPEGGSNPRQIVPGNHGHPQRREGRRRWWAGPWDSQLLPEIDGVRVGQRVGTHQRRKAHPVPLGDLREGVARSDGDHRRSCRQKWSRHTGDHQFLPFENGIGINDSVGFHQSTDTHPVVSGDGRQAVTPFHGHDDRGGRRRWTHTGDYQFLTHVQQVRVGDPVSGHDRRDAYPVFEGEQRQAVTGPHRHPHVGRHRGGHDQGSGDEGQGGQSGPPSQSVPGPRGLVHVRSVSSTATSDVPDRPCSTRPQCRRAPGTVRGASYSIGSTTESAVPAAS